MTTLRPKNGGLLLIVLAATLWGTVGIATRALYGLANTDALSIGFLRLAIATPALLLASWGFVGRQSFHIRAADLRLMVWMGVSMAAYQVFYFGAIARVGVVIAVLITLCTAPVLVMATATIWLRQGVDRRLWSVLGLALAGTALLVGAQPSAGIRAGHTHLSGIVLALGGAAAYASLTLCSHSLAPRYHPLQPITVAFSTGALLLLPFALVTGLQLHYPAAGWLWLLHLGLIPTALAYIFFLLGMRHTSAAVAGIVTLVEPLTSTILARLFFAEKLTPLGLVGATLLFVALAVLFRSGEGQPARQPAGRPFA